MTFLHSPREVFQGSKAIRNLEQFDLVTILEQELQAHALFRDVLGWTIFIPHKSDLCEFSEKHAMANSDLSLSLTEQSILIDMLKPDFGIQAQACQQAQVTWLKWMPTTLLPAPACMQQGAASDLAYAS